MILEFFAIIKVYDGEHRALGPQIIQRWDGYTLEQFQRWTWYFRYRAALLQIKYPRHIVELKTGSFDAKPKLKSQIIKKRITAKKRQITKTMNLLAKAEKHWDELFPIHEDELYKKAVTKLGRLKTELRALKELQNQ